MNPNDSANLILVADLESVMNTNRKEPDLYFMHDDYNYTDYSK